MLEIILLLLILFWLLEHTPLSSIVVTGPVVLYFNRQPVTLWNLFFLGILIWLISVLPYPFRQIGSVVILLWILSVLGIVVIGGLTNLLAIVIILGLLFYILGGNFL